MSKVREGARGCGGSGHAVGALADVDSVLPVQLHAFGSHPSSIPPKSFRLHAALDLDAPPAEDSFEDGIDVDAHRQRSGGGAQTLGIARVGGSRSDGDARGSGGAAMCRFVCIALRRGVRALRLVSLLCGIVESGRSAEWTPVRVYGVHRVVLIRDGRRRGECTAESECVESEYEPIVFGGGGLFGCERSRSGTDAGDTSGHALTHGAQPLLVAKTRFETRAPTLEGQMSSRQPLNAKLTPQVSLISATSSAGGRILGHAAEVRLHGHRVGL